MSTPSGGLQMTEGDSIVKESMMDSTPLFSILTDEQRAVIAERMAEETRRAGDVIYLLGKSATEMYLIKSGWARLVTADYAVLANLGQGSLLGDTDFLTGKPYSTSAEAASDLILWSLNANDFADITLQYPDIARRLKVGSGVADDQRMLRHLRKLSLLVGLSQEQVADVAGHLRQESYGVGQSIYRQGMPGDALYLIDTGEVEVSVQRPGSRQREVLSELGPGEFFGETVLLSDEPHESDVVARTEVVAWALSRADFEALAMRYPSLVLNLSRMLSKRLRETTARSVTTVHVREVRPVTRPAHVVTAKPRVEPQTRRSDVTGAMAALTRSAQAVSSWFGSQSTGAKLRLIAVVLLLIWLLGVAAPSAIISLLSRAESGGATNNVAGAALNDPVLLVAMSADLPAQATATYTPWPTETPVPTATFTPSPTPTDTPVPTATSTPSPTSVPPTATPVPVAQVAQPVAKAEAVAAAAVPSVKYKLIEMRRMTPCENRGKHNVYVKVIDAAGNPVDGVTLIQSPANQPGSVLDKTVSGTKGPGLGEFVLWKMAEYAVYVSEDGANPSSSDVAQPVHSNFTDEATCDDGGGGNTLFHNSFNLVFQKLY